MQGLDLSCAEIRTPVCGVTAAPTCASPGTSGPEPPGSGLPVNHSCLCR